MKTVNSKAFEVGNNMSRETEFLQIKQPLLKKQSSCLNIRVAQMPVLFLSKSKSGPSSCQIVTFLSLPIQLLVPVSTRVLRGENCVKEQNSDKEPQIGPKCSRGAPKLLPSAPGPELLAFNHARAHKHGIVTRLHSSQESNDAETDKQGHLLITGIVQEDVISKKNHFLQIARLFCFQIWDLYYTILQFLSHINHLRSYNIQSSIKCVLIHCLKQSPAPYMHHLFHFDSSIFTKLV